MNKLIALCLLLVACNPQATTDLQAEYDSVLKEQQAVNEALRVGGQWVEAGANVGQDLKNDTTEIGLQKFIDSLTIRKEQLEKRRQQLAQELYK